MSSAKISPSAGKNPSFPVLIGVIIAIIIFLLFILFVVMVPPSIDSGAEDREEKTSAAVNLAVEQAMENVNESGTIYQKEPDITMSPELLAIDKPFAAEEEKEEQELDS